mmetsp:Transcript_24171/g.53606  ORF Transcript_24171/g.53606 Transcript_24171/m.53606 type:complete len:220 (+) Transcript_24171:344-1003(+)
MQSKFSSSSRNSSQAQLSSEVTWSPLIWSSSQWFPGLLSPKPGAVQLAMSRGGRVGFLPTLASDAPRRRASTWREACSMRRRFRPWLVSILRVSLAAAGSSHRGVTRSSLRGTSLPREPWNLWRGNLGKLKSLWPASGTRRSRSSSAPRMSNAGRKSGAVSCKAHRSLRALPSRSLATCARASPCPGSSSDAPRTSSARLRILPLPSPIYRASAKSRRT